MGWSTRAPAGCRFDTRVVHRTFLSQFICRESTKILPGILITCEWSRLTHTHPSVKQLRPSRTYLIHDGQTNILFLHSPSQLSPRTTFNTTGGGGATKSGCQSLANFSPATRSQCIHPRYRRGLQIEEYVTVNNQRCSLFTRNSQQSTQLLGR